MSRKTYYKECPFCGANLDPGEKCQCQEQESKQEREKQNLKVIGFKGRLYARKNEKK